MDLLALFAIGALLCGMAAFIRTPQMPRYWLLLAIASVPQLGLLYGIDIAGMIWVSIATVALWGYANRRVPGVAVIAAGMLMNLAAMALHGGRMPIHADVLAQLGAAVPAGTVLAGSKDIVVDSSPLLWLSDHIVLGSGDHTYIASIGDFIVLLGIVGWLTLSEAPNALIFSESPERKTAHARAVYTRPT